MKTIRLLPALLAASISVPAAASDWPQFRGPGSTGVSTEKGLPEEWGPEKNVAWHVPIPGRGWSSPIVWGEKVFITSAVSDGPEEEPKKGLYFGGDRDKPSPHPHRWVVLCLDLKTGKTIWERAVHAGLPESSLHIKNTHASETPVTDGERVYAYFGNVGLFALDMEGKVLWSRKWGAFKTRYGWGTAASPALHAGKLYIVNDNEEKSFLAAVDARSGDVAWRVERDEKSNWATPYIWRNEHRTEIVTPGTGKVRSYDLDGKVLWELGGLSSITIPTPFSSHGLLYLGSGYVLDKKQPIFAVKPGASGDITPAEGKESPYIAWWQPRASPYNPSFIVNGDFLHVLLDGGFLTSYDSRTGKLIHEKKRLAADAGRFTASPWVCGGKLYCLSEDGDTFVVEPGPEPRVTRRNSLGEMCMATPAIARGCLLIRTLSELYCIRGM